MTIQQAKQLRYGEVLKHRHLKGPDGKPYRCRVSGKPQTWKTRPDEVKVPVKFGLYHSFYLEPWNLDEWSLL